MNIGSLFVIQFLWFVVVWATIANLFVLPMTKGLEQNDKLLVWLSPQLFRVLGLGLLVQNLAPDLPRSFALPTAIGDCLTAVLALISIIALRQRWASAYSFALACNIVGSIDLAIALPHAAIVKAANFLTGQWYVPVVVVPLMIVSHFMTFLVLFRHRS
jgi:hypothetical protein